MHLFGDSTITIVVFNPVEQVGSSSYDSDTQALEPGNAIVLIPSESSSSLRCFTQQQMLGLRYRRSSRKKMTIEALEEKLRQAMLNSDVQALDELIADDLVFTMHTGLVINKQDDLNAHRTGIQKFTQVNLDEHQVRHYGDCAVVTVKADLAGIFNGQAYSETYRFTRVWIKRQDRWQIAAGHVSQVSDAPLFQGS
jgi:ketosteroid isomerase-like protein